MEMKGWRKKCKEKSGNRPIIYHPFFNAAGHCCFLRFLCIPRYSMRLSSARRRLLVFGDLFS
jgi:hypothetical protein